MQIDSGPLSFVVPPGLEDHTLYAFRAHASKESLLISFGPVPPQGGMPSVIASRLDEIQTVLDSKTALPQGPTQVHGYSAWRLGFTLEENARKLGQRWAWILLDPAQYVQLTYTAVSDVNATKEFERIFNSISPSNINGGKPVPAGYTRRHIRQISIDLPSNLLPPRMYELESPDGETRIRLVLYDPVRGDSSPRSIEQQIDAEAEQGNVPTERQMSPLTINEGFGRVVSYSATNVDGESRAVRRAQLSFRNGVSIILDASSPQPAASALEAAVSNLLNSTHLSR